MRYWHQNADNAVPGVSHTPNLENAAAIKIIWRDTAHELYPLNSDTSVVSEHTVNVCGVHQMPNYSSRDGIYRSRSTSYLHRHWHTMFGVCVCVAGRVKRNFQNRRTSPSKHIKRLTTRRCCLFLVNNVWSVVCPMSEVHLLCENTIWHVDLFRLGTCCP